jgi:hypothetical protein
LNIRVGRSSGMALMISKPATWDQGFFPDLGLALLIALLIGRGNLIG